MKLFGQPIHFTNEEIEVQVGKCSVQGCRINLLQDLLGPNRLYSVLGSSTLIRPCFLGTGLSWWGLSLFSHLLFFHCSPPGNECPGLQPPVHGKIEPLQDKYFFKDQVLVSCDTGYKVLKVQGPAWEPEPLGQRNSPELPRADGVTEFIMVPPQYFPTSP